MNLSIGDVNTDLKKHDDLFFNSIFADGPYNLGSKVYVDNYGIMKFSGTSTDFMNKWFFSHEDWDTFFKEAYRTMKHGAFCILYGMDRQQTLIQYYAIKAGFEVQQSLYWYFITGFPKATDVSKGLESRDMIELSKKYDGWKYSIAPFKQVVETVMIFRKPTKYKTTIDDIKAYENGDKDIHPAILNIEAGRVCGRFPSQMFIDEWTASRIDLQSGNRKGWSSQNHNNFNMYGGNSLEESSTTRSGFFEGFNDDGGASRINNIIEWTDEEMDLLYYEPKVNKTERNAGLSDFSKKQYSHDGRNKTIENPFQRNKSVSENNHPTLKPLNLNKKIFELFTVPDLADMKVYVPFAGTFSEVIGVLANGIKEENVYACELSDEYAEIGKARLTYWRNHDYDFKGIKKKDNKETNELPRLF